MEPDFAKLDISVGDYYKLIMEKKRVTRKAVHDTKAKDQPHPEEKKAEPPKKPPRQYHPIKHPKAEPKSTNKRASPEESENQPQEKEISKPKKKVKKEPKKKEAKQTQPLPQSERSLQRYSQGYPDGVFRANIAGRIAFLKQKQGTAPGTTQPFLYVKFLECPTLPNDSYSIEILDQENPAKKKEPPTLNTISLKKEKVYLIIEPAWLCLSVTESQYQPSLILQNVGRTDIEDLQLPEQQPPAEAKGSLNVSSDKQSIFSSDVKVLIMNPMTFGLSKCSTGLLFHYNPSLDASVRQDAIKNGGANLKVYGDLDYAYDLNQKWLQGNQSIEVKENNVKECLFSEVTFDGKRGVLLNYNPSSKGLCIRVYYNQAEDSAVFPPEISWIYLNDPKECKVSANMLKGRITLVELEGYVDKEENAKDTKQESYTPHYKYCEIQEDDDAKQSLSQSELEIKRCKTCNYVLDKLEYIECCKCGDFYHKQCLSQEILKIGLRDKRWRCPNCIRCCACLSTQNKEKLHICKTCNTGYHLKCLEPDVLSQMPSTTKANITWKCDKCSTCVSCGATKAGNSKNSKWSYDYTLCSKCKKRKVNNQFCPICERVWTSVEDEPMIQCQCNMWVHKSCDNTLTDTLFNTFEQTTKEYVCPKCRQTKRNLFIMQIIDILIAGDKLQLFYNPVDVIVVPNYTNVIKKPMCFKKMQERTNQGDYLTNPEELK